MMIPRIIHQIYLDDHPPPNLQANIDRLKTLNPSWEHRLWTTGSAKLFIRDHYGPTMLSTFMRIDPRYGAARADLLRHLVIHSFGGVYCDIKSGFSRPLNDVILFDDEYLLAQWNNGFELMHRELRAIPGGEFVTYFIIAKPDHPFSAAAISRIVDNIINYRPWSSVGRNGVLRTTGPVAYTLAVHPLLDQHSHRFVKAEELGAYWTLGPDYDHLAQFRSHYSTLTCPLVQLDPIAAAINRCIMSFRARLAPKLKRGSL